LGRAAARAIPIDEALEINQGNAVSSSARERTGVTSRPRSAIMRCLPIMIHFHVNATIAGRITRRGAGIAIVRDNRRVEDVKREIVDRSTPVRPSSICSIVAGRRVLRCCTRPLDCVDLHKEAAGGTRRMPPGGSRPWGEPTFRHATANGCCYARAPRTLVKRRGSGSVRSNVSYPHSCWVAGNVRIPGGRDRA
jgi:hypothetical protein